MVGFWRKIATEGAKKLTKSKKGGVGSITGVGPRTTQSHALKKFRAKVKGIEEGIESATTSAKKAKMLPKKRIEDIGKKVKLEQKSEAVKKLLKENQ
tara:strand:- start:215 stop:505 length:291 start_codon:yes stop_codon:yes gene_type:complete